ncbi:MAG: response regulator [Deltaproteobacteria bacterium]|nr:response regulator [Deltaproteobacteria bacterium]
MTPGPQGRRLLVLVLDDDPAIRTMLAALLQQEGFDHIEAQSADEALAHLGSQPIDLVLSDVQLPGIDGIGFLERASEKCPDVPVIMMTAFGERQRLVSAIKLGAFDYLDKPFTLTSLREALHRAAGRRRVQRARKAEALERGRLESLLAALAGAGNLDDLMRRVTVELPPALDVRGFAVYLVAEADLSCIGGRDEEGLRSLASRCLLTCLPASEGSSLAIPLLAGMEPIGVLVVERELPIEGPAASEPRTGWTRYSPSDQRLLARAAGHLAAAIASRSALEELQDTGLRMARDAALEQAAQAARQLARPLASLASAVRDAEGHLTTDPQRARARLEEARAAIDELRRELDTLTRDE